jgi:hypothetical protein
MPFKSVKQRKFMYAKHPEIAKRWTKKYGSKVVGKKDKGFYGHIKIQTLF